MDQVLAALRANTIDTAILAGGATLLGVIVVFVIVYMLLERKKKSLIAILLVLLAGFGGLYWYLGTRIEPPKPPPVPSTYDMLTKGSAPVKAVVPVAQPQAPACPPPARVIKKAAKPKPKPPLQICSQCDR